MLIFQLQHRFRRSLLCVLLMCFSVLAFAQTNFIVKNIQVQGATRVPVETIKSYLPIRAGERMTQADSEAAVHALYETGFFTNVQLLRSGNTLIVKVEERPTVSQVSVEGNTAITKDNLMKVFKDHGLYVGAVYQPSVIEQLKQGLEAEYDRLGYYNMQIRVKANSASQNRVFVDVKIAEGKMATIREIRIVGNHAFAEKTLLKQMTLTTPGLFTFITHNDRYSREKLDKDLQTLGNYYMDHGYIRFKVDSYQVSLSPDRESVYISIHITEGMQYRLQGYDLTGTLILPRKELDKLVQPKLVPGEIFSRKHVSDAAKAISHALGNRGYAFAVVNPVPRIDDSSRMVFMNFFITPGEKVYVRRITFSGNDRTQENVLRNSVQQFEGGVISTDKVNESKRRLRNLGYLQNVKVKTVPVPGRTDQVDLNYSLKELPSAQAFFQVGYGTNGFLVGAGLNQSNFLGTGKTVNLSFTKDSYQQVYRFTYTNPYYNLNGVSRSFSTYYSRYTPGNVDIATYGRDDYGASVSYGIPITNYQSVNMGVGYDAIHLQIHSTSSPLYQNFKAENGDDFHEIKWSGGWTYSDLDRSVFPTEGLNQSLGLMLAQKATTSSLNYYTADYLAHGYYPLNKTRSFVVSALGETAYGNGLGSTNQLPFFENYYGGGVGSVRGYENNSLGPRDASGNPLGGNAMARGSVSLIFPNPISEDVRTSVFVDAGNVYNTQGVSKTFEPVAAGPLRYSMGIQLEWRLSFLGLIQFDLAAPIHPEKDDKTEWFQFNVGTSF